MNVIQTSVTIHEKRNHPYEYGHYDASITLTAEIAGGENHDDVVEHLRDAARAHVNDELDTWIDDLKETRRVNSIIGKIKQILYNLPFDSSAGYGKESIEKVIDLINQLPESLQDEHFHSLDEIRSQIENLDEEE
jgi:hypothetical protein